MTSDQRIIDNLITLNQTTKGILEVWLVESAYTLHDTGIPEESIHAIDRNRISTRYVGYAQETGVSTI